MGVLRELLTRIGFKTDPGGFKRAKAQVSTLKTRLNSLGETAAGVSEKLDGLARAAIGGAILGGGALITGLVRTNAQFQKLEGNLQTATGSADKAAVAMEKIKAFAATTPFDLEQSVNAFTKLTLLGLDPSERSLRSFGNTAAAMGKELNDFIEAVADAATGEFERLKEFGIKSSKQGEKVVFTFKGQATTIKNDAASIQEFLVGLGEKDFAGAMDRQMAGLTGAFANTKQQALEFAIAVGKGGLNDAVFETTNSLTKLLTVTPEVAAEIGVKLGNAVRKAGEAFKFLVEHADKAAIAIAAVVAQFAVKQGISFAATLVKIAFALSGVALSAVKTGLAMALAFGPVGLLVLAIGAGIAAVVLFSDEISAWLETTAEGEGILAELAGILLAITEEIFPVFQEAITAISEALMPALEGLFALLGSIFEGVMAFIGPIIEIGGTILAIIFRVVGVIIRVVGAIARPFVKLFGFIAKLAGGVLGGIFKGLAKIFDFVMFIVEPIIAVFEKIFEVFENTIGVAIDAVEAFFEFLGDVWDNSVGGIIKAFEQLVANVKGIIQKVPAEILPDSVVKWAHGTSALAVAQATKSAPAEAAAQRNVQQQFDVLASQAGAAGVLSVTQQNNIEKLEVRIEGAPDMSPGDLGREFEKSTLSVLDQADFGLAEFQNLAEASP